MSLPTFKIKDNDPGTAFDLMQTNWAAQLNPLLNHPFASGSILKGVSLSAGSNTINHKLQRKIVGWFPVRFKGGWSQLYDNQNINSRQDLTLLLVASAPVTIDLFVF